VESPVLVCTSSSELSAPGVTRITLASRGERKMSKKIVSQAAKAFGLALGGFLLLCIPVYMSLREHYNPDLVKVRDLLNKKSRENKYGFQVSKVLYANYDTYSFIFLGTDDARIGKARPTIVTGKKFEELFGLYGLLAVDRSRHARVEVYVWTVTAFAPPSPAQEEERLKRWRTFLEKE